MTGEENEGDWHPPHVRSPPTFQPWLCLWWTTDFDGLLIVDSCSTWTEGRHRTLIGSHTLRVGLFGEWKCSKPCLL